MKCSWVGCIFHISVEVNASTAGEFRHGNKRQRVLITRLTEMQAKWATLCAETKYKSVCWFAMYYVMPICCLKENGPPSGDSDSDGDGDIHFETPKLKC